MTSPNEVSAVDGGAPDVAEHDQAEQQRARDRRHGGADRQLPDRAGDVGGGLVARMIDPLGIVDQLAGALLVQQPDPGAELRRPVVAVYRDRAERRNLHRGVARPGGDDREVDPERTDIVAGVPAQLDAEQHAGQRHDQHRSRPPQPTGQPLAQRPGTSHDPATRRANRPTRCASPVS